MLELAASSSPPSRLVGIFSLLVLASKSGSDLLESEPQDIWLRSPLILPKGLVIVIAIAKRILCKDGTNQTLGEDPRPELPVAWRFRKRAAPPYFHQQRLQVWKCHWHMQYAGLLTCPLPSLYLSRHTRLRTFRLTVVTVPVPTLGLVFLKPSTFST